MQRKGRRRGRNEGNSDLSDDFGCWKVPGHEFIHMENFGPCEMDSMKHPSLYDQGA